MANKITIDIEVNGKMQKATVSAKKLNQALNETGKNARTADRNVKGVAQASSGASKNFSKMSQGMGGLVGVYASFAAQVFALSAAFGFLKRSADLENLRKAQTDFASSTGLAIRTLTDDLQQASKGMLSFKDAAQASAIGVAKGFSGAQLEQLTDGAVRASKALGITFDDTFSRLLRGVSKAEPELLDELGITLRLESATQRYATAIGKSRDALNTAERSQAVFVETMRQLNDTFGSVKAEANPFVELQTTFQRIVEDITADVLPAISAVVAMINNNAKIAAAAFGVLAGLIILNLSGFGFAIEKMTMGIGKGIGFAAKKVGSGVSGLTKKATGGIGSFIAKKAEDLELAALFLEEKLENIGSKLKSGAEKAVEKGAKSATLSKLALGKEVTPQALGKLKTDLARVKKEIEETGKTASKAFAGLTVSAIDEMTDEIEDFEKNLNDSERKMGFFRKTALKALKGVQKAAGATSSKIKGIGGAFDSARSKASKLKGVFKVVGVIAAGVFALSKALGELEESPLRVIDGFKKMIVSVVGVIQKGLNLLIRGLNALLANSIVEKGLKAMGYDTSEGIFGKFTFADGLKEKLDELEGSVLSAFGTSRANLAIIQGQFDFVKGIVKQEQDRVAAVKDLREEYSHLAKDFADIFAGKAGKGDFEAQMKAIASGDLLSARTQLSVFDDALAGNLDSITANANALTAGRINQEQFNTANTGLFATRAALESERQKANDLYRSILNSPEFKKLPLIFQEALRGGSNETITELQTQALAYGAGIAELRSSGLNLQQTLGTGDPRQLLIGLESLMSTYQNLQTIEEKFGESDSRNEEAMERFLGKNWKNLIPELQGVSAELEYLRGQRNDIALQEVKNSNLPTLVKAERQRALNEEKAKIALTEKQALLFQMGLRTQFNTQLDREAHKENIANTELEIDLLKEKLKLAQEETDVLGRIGTTAMQSFESGMASAVTSIIDGTASIKEAFLSMTRMVVQALAQIIAQMIAVRIMQAIIGMTQFGGAARVDAVSMDAMGNGMGAQMGSGAMGAGPTRLARYGGMFDAKGNSMPGYAVGGIAKGSQAGYPAILHGTEAVVPLPNGKSIPVDMKGAGQQNNVTVNVSVDSNGKTTQDTQADSNDSQRLGTMIASAVQKELHNQKRAGGILNPMGAS